MKIKEFFNLSSIERWFILTAMFCSFCITAEYAIVRPVSNSLFLHAYGSEWLPYAWLTIVPLNLAVVSLYNKLLPKLGPYKMFLAIISVVISLNLFFALFLQKIPVLSFFLYCWKEVYILLMFQQLWSVIHSTIKTDRAKYLYGIFYAMGGIGGVLGSMAPGFFAVSLGTESLLFITIPIYLVLGVIFYSVIKYSDKIRGETPLESHFGKQETSMLHGLRLIKGSSLLKFILLLVVSMQLIATFVDYQFNTALQQAVADKDLRTEYAGRILGIVNFFTVCFQFVGSFLLIHFLGLRKSHFFVPLVLAMSVMGSLFFPIFSLIAFAYIAVKSFDFSFFGIIKEMLYIPLKVEEKYHAKAVIDVFSYRSAKALGSLLILFFQFLQFNITSVLTWVMILIFAFWIAIVVRMFKTYDSAAAKA